MIPPVVIGALGGSGTRLIARIVQRAGYFIGDNLNESQDAMDFVEFYDRWINRFILRKHADLCDEEIRLMDRDFNDCLERHRASIASSQGPWGWKEPRSIYLLPFFHAKFPEMKFVHVVRDGRDMAFSTNQNQLRKHGAAVLETAFATAPQPLRTAALWAAVNLEAAAYGEEMGKRYLLVKFESVCADPRSAVERILDFLEVPFSKGSDAISEVAPPASVGRWRTAADEELSRSLEAVTSRALRKLGYL